MANINVRVVDSFGQSCYRGAIEAQRNMDTNFGKIITVSGLLVETGSGVDQDRGWHYDHECFITVAHATGFWAWPTGVNVISFSHSGEFPTGNRFNVHATSGHAYADGDLIPTGFGR